MSPTVDDALRVFSPALPLAVGYSGGADSTALLVACAEKWPGQVRAIHVHHGLQPAADDFVRHCEAVCAQLQVPLCVQRVDGSNAPGESPEDAARKARYAAFRLAAQQQWPDAPLQGIALAQHADDQAETMLLALSRGAGLPGLSAMPARWQRDGLTYHRPLLQVPAPAIRHWLAQRGLPCIEDPSNTDQRFVRNRIRAHIMPSLADVFPHFRVTFARSADHAAQAQALLLEVAREDLAVLGSPPVIRRLHALSQARQANALRHWLQTAHQATPSAAQLEQLLAQVAACTTRGHQIHIKVANGHVTREGEVLRYRAEPDGQAR